MSVSQDHKYSYKCNTFHHRECNTKKCHRAVIAMLATLTECSNELYVLGCATNKL